MYVFGGCDTTGRFMDDLHVLDLNSGVWTLLGSSLANEGADIVWPTGRHFHGAVGIGTKMYVFFGKSNGYMNDVWVYNTMKNVWKKIESKTEPPSRRYGHTVVEWSGDIYIYGGFDDFGLRCNDLWKYKCELNTWTPVIHLHSTAPDALHHSSVVYQGSMLVWSGMEGSSDLYEFRFGSRSWSKVVTTSQQCPRPKWGHKSFMYEDCMYVVCGTDSILTHNSIWQFSMITCEWTLLGEADGCAPRYFFSLCVFGSNIVIFGGKNVHNYAFNDVVLWKYQAAGPKPVSTYKSDFLRLLDDAENDYGDGDVLLIETNDGRKVFGHKSILYCQIPILRTLQSSKMDQPYRVVYGLFHFMYTKELPSSLTRKDLMALMKVAAEWELLGLKETLEGALIDEINDGNVVETLGWSAECREKYGLKLPKLSLICVRLVVPEFEKIRKRLKEVLPESLYASLKEYAREKK
jgi:hypothetical protein